MSLLVATTAIAFTMKVAFPYRGMGGWNAGELYTKAVIIIAIYVFFIRNILFKEVNGFLALGSIFMLIWSLLLDVSAVRFLSYSMPFFAAAFTRVNNKLALASSVGVFGSFWLISLYYWI
jgi:hypothetical protein